MGCNFWITILCIIAVGSSVCFSSPAGRISTPLKLGRSIKANKDDQPKITYSKATEASPADDLQLDCAVEGVDLSGLAEFNVKWFKLEDGEDDLALSTGEKIHPFSDRYSILHPENTYQYSLRVADVKDTDSGTYRCTINFGSDQKINADVPVIVKTPAYFADTETKKLVVKEGDAISIDCQPGGSPPPDVHWEKVGADEDSYYSGSIYQSNQFDLPLIDRSHRGNYRCHADNGLSAPVTSEIVIDVLYKPSVEVFTQKIAANVYDKNVQLICSALGNPIPDVVWVSKEEPVLDSVNINVRSEYDDANNKVSSTLSFHEAQPENFGTYTCTAQNELDTASEDVFLEMKLPPKIEKQTRGEMIFEVKNENRGRNALPLEILCEASGEPTPTYRWLKNDEPITIEADSRMSLEPGTGNLLITDPTPKDNGYYQCFAYNELGRAASDVIRVRNSSEIEFNLDGHQITEFEAELGRPYHLTCPEVTGYPIPDVTWAKSYTDLEGNMEMQFLVDERTTVDPLGNLWFSHIEQDDDSYLNEFEYMCIASNELDRADLSLIKSSKIKTIPPHDGEVNTDNINIESFPMFTSPTKNTFKSFSSNKLWCIFGGEPVPNIVWSKGDVILEQGQNEVESNRFRFLNFGSTLVLAETLPADAGEYRCTAYNSVGEQKSAIFEVDVKVAPKFRMALEDQSQVVPEGISVAFQCGIEASDGVFEWFFNTRPLEIAEGSRRRVEGSLLYVDGVTTADTGNYACRASNEVGYVYGQLVLSVIPSKETATQPGVSDSVMRVLQGQVESLRTEVLRMNSLLEEKSSRERTSNLELTSLVKSIAEVILNYKPQPPRLSYHPSEEQEEYTNVEEEAPVQSLVAEADLPVKQEKTEFVDTVVQTDTYTAAEGPVLVETVKEMQDEAPMEPETPVQPEAAVEDEAPMESAAPMQDEAPMELITTVQPETQQQDEAPMEPESPVQPEPAVEDEALMEGEAPMQDEAPESEQLVQPETDEAAVLGESAKEPEALVQPEAPMGNEAPKEPELPVQPETPVELEAPVQPETPMGDEAPKEPELPVQPESPVELEAPVKPEALVESEVPPQKDEATMEPSDETTPVQETAVAQDESPTHNEELIELDLSPQTVKESPADDSPAAEEVPAVKEEKRLVSKSQKKRVKGTGRRRENAKIKEKS